MSASAYPFIDIAVHDAVRGLYAAGVPVVVLSADLSKTIWANGAGAELFGFDDVQSMIETGTAFDSLSKRQMLAMRGFPAIGSNRSLILRLNRGLKSQTVSFQASAITLDGSETAILLASAPQRHLNSEEKIAQSIIHGIAQDGYEAACLDTSGKVIAATVGFDALGMDTQTMRDLTEEVRDEEDRMVKRMVGSATGNLPAGIARLTDDPAYHLLVVVDEIVDDHDEDDLEDATEQAYGEAEDEPSAEIAQPEEAIESKEPSEDEPQPFGRRKAPPETSSVDSVESKEIVGPKTDETARTPVRFVWKTDAKGNIIEISDSFADAIGEKCGNISGRDFADVISSLGLDRNGEILRLMERRDTWSGRQVMWPTDDGRSVPVDLAALPIYDRARDFQGFRGFGVARIGEAVIGKTGNSGIKSEEPGEDAHSETAIPQETPASKSEQNPELVSEDPFAGEVPAIEISDGPKRRESDKVIDLSARRTGSKNNDADNSGEISESGLSAGERSAFEEIAERLKKEAAVDTASPLAFGKRRPLAEKGGQPSTQEPEATDSSLDDFQTANDEKAIADGNEPAQDTKDRVGENLKAEPEFPSATGSRPSAFAGLSQVIAERQAGREVLSTLNLPLVVYDEAGLKFANPAFLDFTQYIDLDDVDAAGGIEAIFSHIDSEASSDDFDGETRIFDADGNSHPVEAHLHSIPWEGQKALMLSFSGKAEAADTIQPILPAAVESPQLQQRIDELVSILDTATDGVITLNEDATIRTVNRSAEALFGRESEELTGKPFTNLFAVESQRAARDYVSSLSELGVASLLNDGREVIGREAKGRFIPLFMTMGKLPGTNGYCAVLRDITQWKRAEDELTEAKRIAEQSSSHKTDFLARISHEIRTPLNAIIGFSELMLDEKFGPINNDRYRDYLGDINRSGNHVLDLVNDLLDISKIEAGQLDLNYEAVALNDTLGETIAIVQPQANRERVIVRSSLSSGLPDIVADVRSIRQIALNLLSNAIRYTLAGGQVIVSTTYEPDGSVVLRVRDTGVGMSQVEINQALKPFRQLNTLKRTTDKGSGLGLPLTKAMVEANRAKFSIDSTPGEGTLVEVIFPPARVLAD